jgi:hypothetical protein
MLLRPFLNDATSCASYLFGCGTYAKLAVVDPHAELVDGYLANATALGAPIVARGTVDPLLTMERLKQPVAIATDLACSPLLRSAGLPLTATGCNHGAP